MRDGALFSEAIQMEEGQRSSYVMDSLGDLYNNTLKDRMILSSKQKVIPF